MRTSTRLSAFAALCVSTLAVAAEPVEVFVDKGDVFIRAGSTAGVQKGDSVVVLGELIATTSERRRAGTAVVMEVWPSIARVSLDETARAAKGKLVAVLERGAPPAPPPTPPAAPPTPPPAPPTPATGLKGHATYRGAGPWKLLQLHNEGSFGWTECKLRLPGNLYYVLPKLKAGDHEAIARSNFKLEGPEIDVPVTEVRVSCREGTQTFRFDVD